MLASMRVSMREILVTFQLWCLIAAQLQSSSVLRTTAAFLIQMGASQSTKKEGKPSSTEECGLDSSFTGHWVRGRKYANCVRCQRNIQGSAMVSYKLATEGTYTVGVQ